METFEVSATDAYGFGVGKVTLHVHPKGECAGPNCVIHNPSHHPLSDAPLHWRADTSTMERICPHGVGHPDPDDIAFKASVDPEAAEWFGVHGCDGCCQTPETQQGEA